MNSSPDWDQSATGDADLLLEHREKVLVLTLNRPERLNALSQSLLDRLREAIAYADAHAGVSVIVLRGAGRAFCSGYDMKQSIEGEVDDLQHDPHDVFAEFQLIRRGNHFNRTMWESSTPIVAAVHGYCLAGGLELILHVDLVVCTRSARIGFPPARSQGTPPSTMLVQRLGVQWARRMVFTGDLMSGETAAARGLALEAVDDGSLDERAFALASRMSMIDKRLLSAAKLSMNMAADAAVTGTANDMSALIDAATCTLPVVQAFRQQATELGVAEAWRSRNSSFRPDDPL